MAVKTKSKPKTNEATLEAVERAKRHGWEVEPLTLDNAFYLERPRPFDHWACRRIEIKSTGKTCTIKACGYPARPIARQFKPADMKLLVYGQFSWGKADTLKEAIRNAQNPKKYKVFIVHKRTWVDDFGNLCFLHGYEPKEIMSKGIKE